MFPTRSARDLGRAPRRGRRPRPRPGPRPSAVDARRATLPARSRWRRELSGVNVRDLSCVRLSQRGNREGTRRETIRLPIRGARSHISRRTVRNAATQLVAYAVLAVLVIELVPGLEKAFESLAHVSW